MENATNSKVLFDTAVRQLRPIYGPDEAEAIAFLIVEKTTRQNRTQILASTPVNLRVTESFERALNRVARHEPVQYVLGEAYFFGLSFYVNPSVLIPRPETEMLVDEGMRHVATLDHPKIVDACTGSGCIAIALRHHLPKAHVTGVDVSDEALQVARFNAQRLQTPVHWAKLNVLTEKLPGPIDLLVSNPPYIPASEKEQMAENVTRYEPGLALFVPDRDPLVFYRALAAHAREHLTTAGRLVTEVHEKFAGQVATLYAEMGLSDVQVKKDLAGKDRMVTATSA